MIITLSIPDEAIESTEKWLDSPANIMKVFDDQGQLLNQRRIPTVEAAVEQHVEMFFTQRVLEFPPDNTALAEAEIARKAADDAAKVARQSIMDGITIVMEPGTPVV